MLPRLFIACGVTAVLLLAPAMAAAQWIPEFLGAWGSFGSGPGQMSYPYGIAAGPDGSLYVSDQYNYRIVRFTGTGQVVASWGSYGSGPGQFDKTIGLGVDPSGNVYVADYGNNRVQVFSSQGAFLRQWGYYPEPRDVAISPDGFVHVVGDHDGGVRVFTPEGVLVGEWGVGILAGAISIAFDAAGYAYVCEAGSTVGPGNCVSKWAPGGALVARWGSEGFNVGQFETPAGVAVDASGRVFVADFNNHRVQVFTAEGSFVASWGSYGAALGRFDHPADVAVDGAGLVYVLDMYNHRFQKFGEAPVAATAISWGLVKSKYR